MSQPQPPHREREAQDDIARTRIAPALAPALIFALLAPLLVAAGVQVAQGDFAIAARAIPSPAALRRIQRDAGAWTANRQFTAGLHRFELELEETSPVRAKSLPRAQWATTALLASGNTQAVVGRGGWLHFRADIQHLTGPAFLDRPPAWAEMEAFARLRAPDRELFVLLVPAKTAIHPERLIPELAGAAPLANPSTAELVRRLELAGIRVIDPAPLLVAAASSTGRAQYLATDTHWTPEGMDLAARTAAEAIAPSLSGPAPGGYSRRAGSVAGQGDLARLLRLPENSGLFAAEAVSIQRVFRAGAAVRPQREAPILLLGDSFSLIYSDPSLGFGDSAGLAEQLAFHLQQPVDRLAVYAGGAREALARELGADPSRLDGKRVIVYQLAARHLSAGDAGRDGVTGSFADPSRDPGAGQPAPSP